MPPAISTSAPCASPAPSRSWRAPLPAYLGLLVLAFLLKAGAFPLFAWLPASYHTLPAPVLALVGGLLTKVAAYVLLRLLGDVFVAAPGILLEALGWLALVTMVSGVLGAAYHWDVRRILAFHIVSQIGYLLLGIALATPAGAAATVYFLFHNILVKANLFLIAGLMFAAAGHYDLRRIGGLYPARPLLALLFLLSAFSLVGVPPTSRFLGQVHAAARGLRAGALSVGRNRPGGRVADAVLDEQDLAGGVLEATAARQAPAGSTPAARPSAAYAAVVLLSLIILAMGVFPEPVIRHVEHATAGFWSGALK